MRASTSLVALVAAGICLWQCVMAANATTIGPIIVRGNKMYDTSNNARFIIKGMTYEYVVSDEYYEKYSKAVLDKVLANTTINTLRLYDINPDLSFKKFMNDMAARGVFVLVGATPDNSDYYGKYRFATLKKNVGPDDGETCYSPVLLEFGKKIAKNFAQYTNTLGMLIGNEVMQKDLTAGACVKQYAADLKAWMRANSKNIRTLPLAYAAADSAYAGKLASSEEYHALKIQGLLCGDKMEDGVMQKSIDIYLINEYRWCPGHTFASYQGFQNLAQGLPIVIGFGEYGCKLSGSTRDWAMVPYFYDDPSSTKGFSEVFSGGFAYSFGEAKLPAGSTFPMFTGGSMSPQGQPSNTPTQDWGNLESMFAKHPSYSDPAAWDRDAKCKWAPSLATKVSSTNKRASQSGWIIEDCSADVLKVASSDTWVTKSRQGVDCKAGDDCDVPLKSAVGVTQGDICGADYVATVKPASGAPVVETSAPTTGTSKDDKPSTSAATCMHVGLQVAALALALTYAAL